MNFIRNINGIKIVIIATILSSSILMMNSCEKDVEYSISITNNYFEPLYNINLGSYIHSDTLLINESTNTIIFEKGTYEFSAETESGLNISSFITVGGKDKNIELYLDYEGQLKMN